MNDDDRRLPYHRHRPLGEFINTIHPRNEIRQQFAVGFPAWSVGSYSVKKSMISSGRDVLPNDPFHFQSSARRLSGIGAPEPTRPVRCWKAAVTLVVLRFFKQRNRFDHRATEGAIVSARYAF